MNFLVFQRTFMEVAFLCWYAGNHYLCVKNVIAHAPHPLLQIPKRKTKQIHILNAGYGSRYHRNATGEN